MVKVDKFLGPGQRAQIRSEKGLMVLGVDLKDAREEIFVRLVCDGVSLGVAFVKAGFKSNHMAAASNLFALPRIQERASAILEARRTTGVVTLPEVTSMLQRVFSGAYTEGEYSAAHNAAFSLARLYGHVTDRQTVELIRRPTRDPDAPAEQALSSWVEALPGLPGPGLGALSPAQEARFLRVSEGPQGLGGPSGGPLRGAPAEPLGDQSDFPSSINDLPSQGPRPEGPGPQGPDWLSDIKGLADGKTVPGRPENGAPSRPVTGTPNPGAHSPLLGPRPPDQKGAPLVDRQVPDTIGEFPSYEDLF